MVLSPLFCSGYVRCFPIPLQVCWEFAATLAFCSEQAGCSPAYSLFRAALVTSFTPNLLFLSRLSVGFLGQSGVLGHLWQPQTQCMLHGQARRTGLPRLCQVSQVTESFQISASARKHN